MDDMILKFKKFFQQYIDIEIEEIELLNTLDLNCQLLKYYTSFSMLKLIQNNLDVLTYYYDELNDYQKYIIFDNLKIENGKLDLNAVDIEEVFDMYGTDVEKIKPYLKAHSKDLRKDFNKIYTSLLQ
ncbi:hypothetical protein [Sphingobacterium mizutaii]|uniref:hypothetical protein n=1 Tax=Sphingobacterium mizutaii TaxID=1010 RepID=UPI0016237761|nr:hypothetical protein [Sphingobacterium mizutaii]